MELHEEMRRAGFYVLLVDKFCEHYTIVDDEIVWYGSMNFLSKKELKNPNLTHKFCFHTTTKTTAGFKEQ